MLGFITKVVSSVVKVAVTPLTIVKDIVKCEPFESTEELLESAVNDVSNAFDDLCD